MPPIAISKTKLLSYLQCPRRLWLEQYSPELEDEAAFDTAAIETGRVVGAKAREVFGQGRGHLVSHNRGLRSAISETETLLAAGGDEPIFEATFDHEGLTVLVDVLDLSGDAPRIIEVKASTEAKSHHLADCAIQTWTLRQAGVPVAATRLALINNEFSYAGDDDYSGLFHQVDLSDDVTATIGKVPDILSGARATLDSLDEPDRAVGSHCFSPYTCPFFAHCAPAQGEHPVLELGGRKEPLFELMHAGIRDLRDLSEDQLANETQLRIWRQARSGEAWIAPELGAAIAALGFPRYFLDFETIAFAIPIWRGTRPYEQLPFQWSCHIDTGSGQLRHEEFLDLTGEPPMRLAAESLIATAGSEGPVIVYSSFERRVLRDLATRYPDLAPSLDAIADRLVDLLPLAKAHYYHPAMRGSWSIKAVLPTIDAGIDYAEVGEVQDGEAAQSAYLEAINPETPDSRRDALLGALTAYCRLDTLALVRLVEFLAPQS